MELRARLLARAFIAVLACVGLTAAPGEAATVELTQQVFNKDGWPSLVANMVTTAYEDPPPATRRWRICAPDCGEVVAESSVFGPGPTQPGTRFEVSATDAQGRVTTALSKPWLGRVTNVTPPVVEGTATIGSTIRATPGTWSGGWGGEGRLLGLRAPRTPAALDCRGMEESVFHPEVGPKPFKIPVAYAGWYIGAIETRYAAESAWAGVGLSFPGNILSPYKLTPLTQVDSTSPLTGPVPAATAKQVAAARPTVVFRDRPTKRGKRYVIATVRCPEGCAGSAAFRQGRWRGGALIELGTGGTRTLLVDRRLTRPGRQLKVTVTVGGFGRFTKVFRL